jgi:glycosyltransferase involved in cell wall biosynthesis
MFKMRRIISQTGCVGEPNHGTTGVCVTKYPNPVKPAKSGLSVLMSICASDCPEYLDSALNSLHSQTRQPDELVIVLDGPISQSLLSVLDKWESRFSFPVIRVALEENHGLGFALKEGLRRCSYGIVARMDSDDIDCPQRFEKQLLFLEQHPDVAVVSSWMACFEDDPGDIIFIRKMPQEHETIKSIAKYRNPVLHPPVMFRRSEVEAVGGYNNLRRNQDYHLWVRMLSRGLKISCVPEPLYKFRYNGNFLNRRNSLRHAIEIIRLQSEFVKMGFISRSRQLFNSIVRIAVCLMPVVIFRFIRSKLLKL